MKIAVFIAILLGLHYSGSSCTILPDAFCRTLVQFPENLVLSGVIVSIDSTGIDIEVLDILRGEESRDTIRVWDGTDFDCNGIWSMAASDIGDVYDTIIIILPKIIQIENEWDVIGDYRRPDPYGHTSELKVKEGNAEGFISGDALAPPEYNVWNLNFDLLKSKIIADGDCSSIILATNDSKPESMITVNNPFESLLYVQLNGVVNKGFLKLYAMTGHVYLIKEINSESLIELELQDVPPGIYLLEVNTTGRREIVKLVKQNSR